jgi:hypothetical protein
VATWWLGGVSGSLRMRDELLARSDLAPSYRQVVASNRRFSLGSA